MGMRHSNQTQTPSAEWLWREKSRATYLQKRMTKVALKLGAILLVTDESPVETRTYQAVTRKVTSEELSVRVRASKIAKGESNGQN